MGQRIRTIKPDFFTHEGLADLSILHRLLFIGLWTLADKRGRLLDRPRRIKVAVFPYDDQITSAHIDEMLSQLAEHPDSFLVRYNVGGKFLIEIPGFLEHQRPHHKEPDSTLPGSDGKNAEIHAWPKHGSSMAQAWGEGQSKHESKHDLDRDHAWLVHERGREGKGREGMGEGKGKEGKGREGKENREIAENRPQDIFGGGES